MIGQPELFAGLAVLGVVFALGGCAGVYMAFSMEQRFRRWALGIARLQELLNEAEEKNDVAAIADLRRRLGLDDPPAAAEGDAGRPGWGQASVQPVAGAAVVNSGPGSSAVRAS